MKRRSCGAGVGLLLLLGMGGEMAVRPAWAETDVAETGTAEADAPTETNAPIEISAQDGIEWQRDQRLYIANGQVKITRSDMAPPRGRR